MSIDEYNNYIHGGTMNMTVDSRSVNMITNSRYCSSMLHLIRDREIGLPNVFTRNGVKCKKHSGQSLHQCDTWINIMDLSDYKVPVLYPRR